MYLCKLQACLNFAQNSEGGRVAKVFLTSSLGLISFVILHFHKHTKSMFMLSLAGD